MSKKEDLVKEAQAKGIQLTGGEKVADLEKMLSEPTEGGSLTTSKDVGTGAGSENPRSRSSASEEADAKKTAGDMKALLAKQDKVPVYVPLEPGEPKGTQLPVEINGYRVNVPKGVVNVMVPRGIAEIIHQSMGIYEQATSGVMSPNDPNRPLRTDLQTDKGDQDAIA